MPAASRRHKKPSLHKTQNKDLYSCPICILRFENEIGFTKHRESQQHLQNYCLAQFVKHRQRLVKNRHGIAVKVLYDSKVIEPDDTGTIKVTITPEKKQIKFEFWLECVGSEPLIFSEALPLHPYPAFVFEGSDDKNLKKNDDKNFEGNDAKNEPKEKELVVFRIHPGARSCCGALKFINRGRGSYGIPISCNFLYKKDDEDKEFQVVRQIVVNVRGADDPVPDKEDSEPSPYRGDVWFAKHLIEGATGDGKPLTKPTAFLIPRELYPLLHHWLLEPKLVPWNDITPQDLQRVTLLMDVILMGYASLESNYQLFFHTLLYLDEYDGIKHLQRYNMRGVRLKLLQNGSSLELKVPGLAEKRPSLLKGDVIHCCFRYENGQTDDVDYEGQITAVCDTSVIVSHFSPKFFHKYQQNPSPLMDVRFFFSRYPISVAHLAVERVVKKNLLRVVFPENHKSQPPLVAEGVKLKFFNETIESNPRQKEAVLNIVKGSCRPAPYIIFGPPGTGKTVTIVEAILQVKKLCKGSRVLVCAPSNAACDMVASKIVPFVQPTEMIRIHSQTREWSTVPKCLHAYSNRSEDLYFFPDEKQMKKFRIVVCTLVSSHKVMGQPTEKDQNYQKMPLFSHVFIDECGQAMEPESLIPIGAGLESLRGMVVLAGDPCQLGPCCNSRVAENVAQALYYPEDVGTDGLSRLNRRMGLGVSLLERLMNTCSLYQKDTGGNYNAKYITKLLLNFRSHPDILALPNKMFYSGELSAHCPDAIRSDRVSQKFVASNGMKPCSVIFHGVLGKEKREGRSPSYFNPYEADQVLHYVRKLLNPSDGIPVKQSDIGIIAPYIRQVYKIKNALKNKQWEDVEVGTTEAFQGREKRVMIISTVRANCNLLDYDHKFRLGFVADCRRFNVAITRAQSQLIIVGNPYQLVHDAYWKALMEFCRDQGSYVGSIYRARDVTWWNYVVKNVGRLSDSH